MYNQRNRYIALWTVVSVLLIGRTTAWNFLATCTVLPSTVRQTVSLFSSYHSKNEVTSAQCQILSFDDSVLNRYACKKFQRYNCSSSETLAQKDDGKSSKKTASLSDPSVIQRAMHCLDLARRTPTAFNTQPYKVVLVYTPEQKMALSRYCLDVNAARVLDSDCTAIFLADKQIVRTLPKFGKFLNATINNSSQRRRPLTRRALLITQLYVTLFSSGYPLPRLLSAPISFLVRTAVAFVNLFTKWFYPMPTLSNAETWSSKQTMMVAMTYMLACTSRGLATIPMEGMNLNASLRVELFLSCGTF
jgi:nitroreductase